MLKHQLLFTNCRSYLPSVPSRTTEKKRLGQRNCSKIFFNVTTETINRPSGALTISNKFAIKQSDKMFFSCIRADKWNERNLRNFMRSSYGCQAMFMTRKWTVSQSRDKASFRLCLHGLIWKSCHGICETSQWSIKGSQSPLDILWSFFV
jgi:hypothetical protein